MKITRGRVKKALKFVFYGPEGIGKSTLAAQFPGAVFMDTEDSTAHMDVARFEKASSWEMLKQQADWVRQNPSEVGTLILDTADWAEQLEIVDLCKRNGWDGIEAPGYGKGYTYSAEEFGKLLNILQGCVNAGVNVVITAHAQLRKVELPEEMGAYDHWEMKTSKKVAPMIREWADIVLFLNYKTVLINVDGKGQAKGKNKATGGRRVMYTTHTPFWDAKNRFGLPDEVPLDFAEIAHILPTAAPMSAPATVPSYVQTPVPPKPEPATASESKIADHDMYLLHDASDCYFMIKKGEKYNPMQLEMDGVDELPKETWIKQRDATNKDSKLAPAPKAKPKSKGTDGVKLPMEKNPALEDMEPIGNIEEFTGWTAHEKSWYRVGGNVYEFMKGEKIPPEIVRDGQPISEDVYLGMIRNTAGQNVKTTKQGGYQEPDMRIPKKLRDLMINAKITEEEIKTLVGAKGYFPADMPVADYPMDFVDGWCVGYWDQVRSAIMEIREKEAYELK